MMQPKGRYWVMFWLLLFLLVTTVIVARQSDAYRIARQLDSLRNQRIVLEAEHAELIRRVREASGRRILVPRVERALGLREPLDSEWENFSPTPDTTEEAAQ
jgi:hypothetical protein